MKTFWVRSRSLFPLALGAFLLARFPAAAAQNPDRIDLAAGREVIFSAAPDRGMPKAGDFGHILTDGILAPQEADFARPNLLKVGWTEGNGEHQRINWKVDLGQRGELDEIAIHFAQSSVPVWGEAFVSDDGEHWVRIAERSRWTDPAFYRGPAAFFHQREDANSAGYWWRWKVAQVHGRYVGVRFWPGMSLFADELQVWGRRTDSTAPMTGAAADFAVDRPQVFFPVPELVIPNNVSVPQSLAATTPQQKPAKGPLELELELPAGVILDAPIPGAIPRHDRLLGTLSSVAKPEGLAGGAMRYRLQFGDPAPNRALTRLFLRAPGLRNGQAGAISWRYRFESWQSPVMKTPFHVVEVPATRAPKRLSTVAFGLWSIDNTLAWPDALASYRHLGFNTISLFGESRAPEWMPPKADDPQAWQFLAEARRQGFKVFVSDATFMVPWRKYPNTKPEGRQLYCQFADGTVSDRICPSYRGPYYREELRRVAEQTAEVRPDILFLDVEAWNGYGATKDCERCSRCQASYRASGAKSWKDWLQAQGREMYRDVIGLSRARLREEGEGPQFVTASYALNPLRHTDRDYTPVAFQILYPDLLQMANESVYSPYFPGFFPQRHGELGGGKYPPSLDDLAGRFRAVREKLSTSNDFAMLVPGDTGAPTGEALQWAILEAFCNGCNGMSFWGRVWTGEDVVAYSRAVRLIAPVEDIVLDGQLLGSEAAVVGAGHLSGLRRGGDLLLLASDYRGDSTGTLVLTLNLATPATVRDQASGEVLAARLSAGVHRLSLPLQGAWARLLTVTALSE